MQINSFNRSQVSFNGNSASKKCGRMAAKLFAEEKLLSRELPSGLGLLNIFNWGKGLMVLNQMKTKYAQAINFVNAGKYVAKIDKFFKK